VAFALRALRTNGDREGAGGRVSAALRFFLGQFLIGDEMLNRAGVALAARTDAPHRVVRERLHLRVHVIEVLHLLHLCVAVHVPVVVPLPGHRVNRVCVFARWEGLGVE